jgi:hypothetical protein
VTRTSVNERHEHGQRVNALAHKLAALGGPEAAGLVMELLNATNEAYAQGYRDGDPENRQYLAVPDGSEVIMDGAGRIVGHVPAPITVHGTLDGRLRPTMDTRGQVSIWDPDQKCTLLVLGPTEGVQFSIRRVSERRTLEANDDPVLQQAVQEVRTRWAASRALPEPHRIVCLPHDFVSKIKARVEDLTDDHGVATGISNAVDMFVDQLDAWTEWDALKGWR